MVQPCFSQGELPNVLKEVLRFEKRSPRGRPAYAVRGIADAVYGGMAERGSEVYFCASFATAHINLAWFTLHQSSAGRRWRSDFSAPGGLGWAGGGPGGDARGGRDGFFLC